MTDAELAAIVKGLAPVVRDYAARAVATAVQDAEARLLGTVRASVDQTLALVTQDVGALRERVAVVEVRPPIPGPAGADGKDGAPGADGLGFDDLRVAFDGERTLSLVFERGGATKAFPIALPILRYVGVFQEGAEYQPGDVVTWAGSAWHAKASTRRRPDDKGAWTLIVKRGADGRDGGATLPRTGAKA